MSQIDMIEDPDRPDQLVNEKYETLLEALNAAGRVLKLGEKCKMRWDGHYWSWERA
jgi:hypothetical protein